MRKIVEFFQKMSILEVCIIILIVGFIIVFFLNKYLESPNNSVMATVSNTIKNVNDKLGEKRQQVVTNISPIISGVSKEEYDKLKKALALKDNEVLALTNIKANLQDSLKITSVMLDKSNNKVWEWQKKYESGSVVKANMNEKDSVLHTSIDVKLNVTDIVKKGGIFKKDRYYTDIYSPDQNIKVNGVGNFRKETIIRPKKIGIGIQAGYGINENFKMAPYIGVGISYNFIRF